MVDASKSETAFQAAFPKAWDQITAGGVPLARVVREGGQAVNLDLGEGKLYPCPAPEWVLSRMMLELPAARSPGAGG